MDLDQPWDMLADNKIWAMLADTECEITSDHNRLMFITLFRRLKNLELENHTLKVLLFLYEYLDDETFFKALDATKEFFEKKDAEKDKEVEFFAKSGISFADWVNFTTKGTFQEEAH